MLPLVLSSISGADVCGLVTRGARESRRLDFKRDLYAIDDTDKAVRADAKRELVADVVAFANSEGGDIVIGVEEKDEVAVAHEGVDKAAAVAFEKRLTNYWITDVDPSLVSVDSRVVDHPTDGGKAFVVIRIRPSTNAPHRTAAERHFYERIGAQKSRLDMPRIRESFLRQDIYLDLFEAFRVERQQRISSENHHGHPWLLIHIVPLHALSRSSRQLLDFKVLNPRNTMSNHAGTNVEYFTASGFFRLAHADAHFGAQGFHVFYDGRYEQIVGGVQGPKEQVLPLLWVMRGLSKCLRHARRIEEQLGHGPTLFALTACDIAGSRLDWGANRVTQPSKLAQGEVIWCPEVRLESLPETTAELARAIAPSLLPLFLAYNLDSVRLPIEAPMWAPIDDECA